MHLVLRLRREKCSYEDTHIRHWTASTRCGASGHRDTFISHTNILDSRMARQLQGNIETYTKRHRLTAGRFGGGSTHLSTYQNPLTDLIFLSFFNMIMETFRQRLKKLSLS
jgi:hypothetical protein